MNTKKLICTALALTLLVQPVAAAPETASEYRGEGMCIAILDAGFYTEHESFVLTNSQPALTKDVSDALIPTLSIGAGESAPESCYISAKIPFAYDYADGDTDVSGTSMSHGTAMLSIAAGNGDLLPEALPEAYGSAPEAQILAMKVYSDAGTAKEEYLVAAIGDAVLLGADVILLSISDPCGFESSGTELEKAIRLASDAGVIVTAPAGNVIKYGSESIYEAEYGLVNVTTDAPDVGTIAYPASIPGVFAVGSSDNNIIASDCFTLADGTKIPYSDTNYLYAEPSGGKTFASYFNGQQLEYVVTEGLGKLEELPGDLTGKLVMIPRGELTFVEKAQNAAERGAVGVIIIDNQLDKNAALSVRMELTGAPIPAVIISEANAKLMAAAAEKSITVTAGERYYTQVYETPSPSSFSARGTTPELGLKPDITAVGETVDCASTSGSYGTISSTSASAAKIAGMCVCVKQRLMSRQPEMDALALAEKTKALLTSSAEIMQQVSGSAYSPRAQGSGAANLQSALSAGLLLTANGDYKIELGDGLGQLVQFSVTAKNLTDAPIACTLDATVGSDGIDAFTFSDLDTAGEENPLSKRLGRLPSDTIAFIDGFKPFAGAKVTLGDHFHQLNAAAADYDPYTFTLDGGASDTFLITIILDESTCEQYRQLFTNGFFIEGYVRLSAADEMASVPFLGYAGNFDSGKALDADLYAGEQYIYDGRWLYRAISDHTASSGYVVLGADPFQPISDSTILDGSALTFSPTLSGADPMVYLNFGLLRSVTDVLVTVTDASGEIISHAKHGNISRTYVSSATGIPLSAQLPLWDGRADNNDSYIYPDGMYTITVSCRTGERIHRFSYDIYLDNTAPELVSYRFAEGENGARLLHVEASDNYKLQLASVMSTEYSYAPELEVGVYDVTDLYGEFIYIELYDTAMNSTIVRIDNPAYEPFDF